MTAIEVETYVDGANQGVGKENAEAAFRTSWRDQYEKSFGPLLALGVIQGNSEAGWVHWGASAGPVPAQGLPESAGRVALGHSPRKVRRFLWQYDTAS